LDRPKRLEKRRERLIHFITSDGHSIDARPPILSDALKGLNELWAKKSLKMVNEYPQVVLEGRMPLPDPSHLTISS
jgi:tyrosine-protein phosphatase YwqE